MEKRPTGGAKDVLPEGEPLERALRWLSERYRLTPGVARHKLIDEAAIRFDLSPAQTQFLLDNWRPDEP